MSIFNKIKIFVILSCFLNGFSYSGTMGNSHKETSEWHFLIAPYGWLASLSADATVQNTTRHVFVPVSKLLKNLDFSGEVHMEANHGDWTFMLDPSYIKVSVDGSAGPIFVGPLNQVVIGPININLMSQTVIIDGGIFYKIFQSNSSINQSLSFELLGGGRYFGLKNTLGLDFNRSQLFPGVKVTTTINALAPIIGGRIKKDYSKGMFWLRADVGGFDVDHVKNTWTAGAGITYKIKPSIDLAIAYRVLKINVVKSSSQSFKALMYGPEVGVVFRF